MLVVRRDRPDDFCFSIDKQYSGRHDRVLDHQNNYSSVHTTDDQQWRRRIDCRYSTDTYHWCLNESSSRAHPSKHSIDLLRMPPIHIHWARTMYLFVRRPWIFSKVSLEYKETISLIRRYSSSFSIVSSWEWFFSRSQVSWARPRVVQNALVCDNEHAWRRKQKVYWWVRLRATKQELASWKIMVSSRASVRWVQKLDRVNEKISLE